ncbi:MAG TPA: diphthine--ammonia ligase [Candidatus Baltobacteraceae bacterium]
MKEKVLFCWSGGKDSALALYRLQHDERYDVVALLSTYNEHFQRVSMHGVRLELSERQADAIGLPLDKVFVSQRSSNEEYALKMAERMLFYKEQGVTTVAFGDIFLEDLRKWREENLAQLGMRAIFPLWKNDTRELIREFIGLGFKSRICCINDAYLDESAVGRDIDQDFIESLPADVDPCGENGEFHSFAYAGPIFRAPLNIECGERVYRPVERTHPGSDACALPDRKVTKGFWFCDLLMTETAALG